MCIYIFLIVSVLLLSCSSGQMTETQAKQDLEFSCLQDCDANPDDINQDHKAKQQALLGKLEYSHKVWQQVRKQSGDYQYQVSFSSWVGFSSQTLISIKQHKVVARNYSAWQAPNNEGKSSLAERWVEQSGNLHSHKRGAKAKTLDQLYSECRVLITQHATADSYFSLAFDHHGLIKHCSYQAKQCVDDCQMGIAIDKLTFQR